MSDLRAIARAATPGPWRPDPWGVWVGEVGNDGVRLFDSDQSRDVDATHIAAWSPDRALAALDVIEAAAVVSDPMVADGGGDRWWKAHDDLRAALDRWEELP